MTYSELVANIAAWADRGDLSAVAPTFIALTEERLNRTLRVNANSASVSLVVLSGQSSVDLPADYLEGRAVTAPDGAWTQRTPEALAELKAGGSNDKSYAVYGGQIHLPFAVGADTTLTLAYWQAIPALTAGDPTNWLSLNHPSIYLFGGLVEACNYVVDAAQAALYESRFSAALADLRASEQHAAYFAAALQPDYVV